jgi:hypothetical protein
MKFSVTSGNPTPQELEVIREALSVNPPEKLVPITKRSVFGLPKLRQPLPRQITFGVRKNS